MEGAGARARSRRQATAAFVTCWYRQRGATAFHPDAGRLKRRQQGQLPAAIAHSWKAQHRLHKVFKRLAFRKNNQIAAVAVARELAGFVWALMQESVAEIEAGGHAA